MVKQVTPVRRVITKTLPAPRGKGDKGAGRGAWVFIPENANLADVLASSGLGRRQQGWQSQKGQSWQGQPGQLKKPLSKFAQKLRGTDPSLKVWVGGLAEGTTWKDVEKHFATVSKPTCTDIMKGGTAVVAYGSVEDVETAVASLNGSELKGGVLEVDVWVQKPKTERAEKEKAKAKAPKDPKDPKEAWKPMGKLVKKMPLPKQRAAGKGKVAKGTGKATKGKSGKGDDKMKEKLAAFSAAQKVWIGGLSESTSWRELETHVAVIAKPKLTHIHRSTGILAFEQEADVITVISSLDGSELKGNTLQFDHWTMPERKGKKDKKAEVKAEEEELE
ncbi:unnamed protein product [Symbiodinium microadriaticum]|nr:unnamed protein product [Symbiodinium microadriaticum]CAE7940941.1 unnamed protein product [Symbiodinium sp. KB8]